MSSIKDTYDYDGAERKYDDEVQRQVDDQWEAEAKRASAGISPEILSLQEAFLEGQRAGARGNGASLNPFQDDTPEHGEWNRGRLSAIGAALNNGRKAA